MIGRTLSHYKVLEKISRGGMGVVYRGLDLKLDREVALKVLPPELVADPERKRRFIQEAKAAAKLDHPHIGMVFEIDEVDGVSFIAMELIRGETLRDVISKGSLPVTRALELFTEVAEGLCRAHDKGTVHRDLKPSNIMVTEDGHAKIIDFGLAKLVEPLGGEDSEAPTAIRDETKSGVVLGTVSYMSPEQARGQKVDHRSDIFSFGIVLLEAVIGRHPFQAPTGIDTLHAILRDPAPRLADMGLNLSSDNASDLQSFLDKCLAKDLAGRYQNMRELIIELRRIREEVSSTARRAIALPSVPKNLQLWAAAALGVVLAGCLVIWSLLGRERSPPGIGASGRPAIAVMVFENLSGDEELRWLSKGLPNMLTTDLSQIPGLDVVSSQRLHQVLKQVGQDDLENIDKSLIGEVAERAGAGAVVVGSVFRSGTEIRIDVQVEDVGSGRILSAESVRGEDVFPLVDELTGRVRRSLNLDGRPSDRPIAEVTTASVEAFRLYSEGLEARMNGRNLDARKLFEEAVKIDPSFAMAYFELWGIARGMRESELEQEYRELVLEHMDRLPARQELLVQAALARYTERNLEKAADLYETLIAGYPDEVDAYIALASLQPESALTVLERGVKAVPHSGPLRNAYAFELGGSGRYPEALRELETYVQLEPDEPNAHDSLALAYLVSGQPEKALQHYVRALEIDPSFVFPFRGRALAYGMLGRYDEAFAETDKELAFATRENVLRTSMEIQFLKGFLLSRVGRYKDAEELFEASSEIAARIALSGSQASIELLTALTTLERGRYSKVLEITGGALGPFQKEQRWMVAAHLLAGVAEARAGNLEAARTELESLREVYRPEEEEERMCFYTLEGEIALAAGDPDSAEVAFYAGEPTGKLNMFSAYGLFANTLPSRDGPARVKAARGDLEGGIDIYRELNTPDMRNTWTVILEPRFVLEVARLLDQKGDTSGARLEYRRFLELWKDADPGLPELDEARRYLGSGVNPVLK